MSELRQDPTTGAWVIIAPVRQHRPQDWRAMTAPDGAGRDGAHATCPFCPGNESSLAAILEEEPQDVPPGWRIRVVPNIYPLVSGDPVARHASRGHLSIEARGCHEVVIESPRHDADLTDLGDDHIAAVVAVYQRRYRAMTARLGRGAVVVFRNRGERAGASLRHPHSQVVGLAVTPPRLRAMARWGAGRYRASGQCPTCAELAREREAAARIIEETESFVALVPFAATGPYETWLVPKRHMASFGAAEPHELAALASLLVRSLRRLSSLLGPVPYNFVIESASGRVTDAPYLHWRLRIVPKLAIAAGFELGSGFVVNPSLPEADAEALRDATPRRRPDP
jgi:UDPglucose--hexose-1-phosphate uridylyltransferase